MKELHSLFSELSFQREVGEEHLFLTAVDLQGVLGYEVHDPLLYAIFEIADKQAAQLAIPPESLSFLFAIFEFAPRLRASALYAKFSRTLTEPRELARNSGTVSFNQLNSDVQQILEVLGLCFEVEKLVCERYCDLYLPDEKVIIELDGSFHYLASQHSTAAPRPKNAIRNALFLKSGYKLIEVQYQQWELRRNSDQMTPWLMKKL